MKKIIFLISFFLMHACAKAADNSIKLTLPEAIDLARTKSVDAVVARGELKSAYWAFRTYEADLLPEL